MNTNTIIYSILLLSILYNLFFDNSIIEHKKGNRCNKGLRRKCNERCNIKINNNCKEINKNTCSQFINNKLLNELKEKEYILEKGGKLIVNPDLVKKKIFEPDENSLDFGGFIGWEHKDDADRNKNPYTTQESCNTDFQKKRVFGTSGKDNPIDVCYKKWDDIKYNPKYMEFGGMYSSIRGRGHPVTGEKKCPDGWETHKILGYTDIDNEIFYCYNIHDKKPEKFTPNAVEFGGVIGTVDDKHVSALKDNNTECPPGFKTRYVMKSDDWDKEGNFAYCYKEIDDEFIDKEKLDKVQSSDKKT